MPGRPAFSAASSAPGATRPARLVFTNRAVGFILPRSAALTMPRVASISRRWIETTSDCSSICSLVATVSPAARAAACEASRPNPRTFMPNARP